MTLPAILILSVIGVAAGLLLFFVRGSQAFLARLAAAGSWFGLAGAAFWFLVAWEWWAVPAGFGVGLAVSFVAGLLDEAADRAVPSFYACLRREIHSLFSTPIPYFVLFLFVVLTGIFFWGNLSQSQAVTVRYVFESVASLGFFLFPLLTMSLYARERSEGTIEVLMTAPVSDASVATAKYFATMAFYCVMLLPTVIYCVILQHIGEEIGKPDLGPMFSAYVGMLLAGSFFISLGLFTSSVTSSQILAALLSWVLIIIFLLSGPFVRVLDLSGTWFGDILEYVDPVDRHLSPFLRGVIDPKDVLFFVSFTVFFLFLAVRATESRKWR